MNIFICSIWISHIWARNGVAIYGAYLGQIKVKLYLGHIWPYMAFILYQVISAQFLYKPDMNSISGPDMGQI